MQRQSILKSAAIIFLAIIMMTATIGCGETEVNVPNGNQPTQNNQATTTTQPVVNTRPINVVWYPNESSNTHAHVRAEVNKLITQATGRPARDVTTTDYTIAIEAIASGSADIAMAMGAVGYIEAKNRNPAVNVMFVNSDATWSLDGAKYFSWLIVRKEDADQYKSGNTYSIDNIKGKKMSFVSNSSTSGFRVPTSGIISHFASENLNEDALIEGGRNRFFSEVYFGQSHQGSAINLLTGNSDISAVCDIELQAYFEIVSGEVSETGSVFKIREGADAPFNTHVGKEFVVIAVTPVFNGPNVYNPANLSDADLKSIIDLFTSEEVAANPVLFFDPTIEGNVGLYRKPASYGFIKTLDSWYDAYR